MVVHYPRAINRYTHFYACTILRIDDRVLSFHKIWSENCILPSASKGKQLVCCLWSKQSNRILFDLITAFYTFQRTISAITSDNKFENIFTSVYNVIIYGKDYEDHDLNFNHFKDIASRYNHSLNKDKCQFRMEEISYLGYVISNGSLCPDPDYLKPLKDMPALSDSSSLSQTLSVLSNYY